MVKNSIIVALVVAVVVCVGYGWSEHDLLQQSRQNVERGSALFETASKADSQQKLEIARLRADLGHAETVARGAENALEEQTTQLRMERDSAWKHSKADRSAASAADAKFEAMKKERDQLMVSWKLAQDDAIPTRRSQMPAAE